MGILICPVCGKKLDLSENTYKCASGHCFDKAKSGYVNLLLSKHMGRTVHGDNKLMVKARRDFLDKGYYTHLCDELCDAVKHYFKGKILLDAGCGEGYYTGAIYEKLNKSDIAVKMYGIDISKIAVEMASKRYKNITYAAASVFHIPVDVKCCDMLVTLFAPYCGEEFLRVLKPDGVMIMAIPSTDHLWELKETIYDIPYKNEVKPYELEGFELLEKRRITDSITLETKDDILSLFTMTPYYYRTASHQKKRLEELDELTTKIDFELLIYSKK